MIELRDVLTGVLVLITLGSMLLVNRNARRANRVHAENIDLTRIRDLRHELTETRTELKQARGEVGELKGQIEALMTQVARANGAVEDSYRLQMEMIRYARMPGTTLDDWLNRFGDVHALGGE